MFYNRGYRGGMIPRQGLKPSHPGIFKIYYSAANIATAALTALAWFMLVISGV